MLETLKPKVLSCLLGVALPLFAAGHAAAQATDASPSLSVTVRPTGADAVDLLVRSGAPEPGQLRIGDRWFPTLTLEDAGVLQEPGSPLLPRRRVLVEIPPDVDVRLEVVSSTEEALGGVHLQPAPRVTTDEATGEAMMLPVPFERSLRWTPEQPVRLESIGWLRHRRVACLELTPVQYNASRGEARVQRSLQVRLHLDGARSRGTEGPIAIIDGPWFEPLYETLLVNPGMYYTSTSALVAGPPPPGAQAPVGGQQPATPARLRWRLKVEADERGLYAITAADLLAAGINPATVDPHRVGMSRRGDPIAIEVEGEVDGSFDPTDRVLFFADPDVNRYRDVNAWWVFEVFTGTGSGEHQVRRITTVDGTPQPGDTPAATFRHTARAETSLKYWQTMPNGAGHDHWYWTRTLAPATTDYVVATPNPAPGGANAAVRAALHGYTNTLQNPDHHTRLILNGVQVDDATWDGLVPHLHDVTVGAGALQPGNNTLQVQQLLDLGALVDGIYADWFEVEYDREFIATAGQLHWSTDTAQITTFAIEQFGAPALHALVVTDTNEVDRLVNGVVDDPGSGPRLTFRHDAQSGEQYFVAEEAAVRSPLSLAAGVPPIEAPPAGADLLIVAEDAFAAALAPLVQQREQAGLRVTRVSPQAIYDTYGGGEFDPEAITAFVKDAFETWTAPAPSFVLLVGEATFDYRDHWGYGPWSSAPTYLYQSVNDIELPSDNHYVTVAGDDSLPDLHIGRLPAATPAEATTLVTKILGHETSPPAGAWQDEVVHIADFGPQFVNALNAAALQVPAPYSITNVFADSIGSASSTRAAILSELSQGCAIGTYFGHGAVFNWGTQLMDAGDVSGLQNGGRLPLVLALNCLNGFYALYAPPGSPPRSLAEEFVLEPSGGAVACIAPSGLGQTWEYQRVLAYVYERTFLGQDLGQVHTGAKVEAFLMDSASEESLWSLVLFGDPSGIVLP